MKRVALTTGVVLLAASCSLFTNLDSLSSPGEAAADGSSPEGSTNQGDGGSVTDRGGGGGGGDGGYRELVLSDEPFAYWRLGEGEGELTAVDETGHGNDGKYISSAYAGRPGAIAGDPNGAAAISGNGIIEIGVDHGNFTGKAPITLEAWAASKGTDGHMIGKGAYTLFLWGNSIRFDYVGDQRCVVIAFEGDAGGLLDGTYHHYVAVYDLGNVRLYIDGVEQQNRPCEASLGDDDAGLHIGGWGYAGDLDEVALYNKVLLPPRIREHYHKGIGH